MCIRNNMSCRSKIWSLDWQIYYAVDTLRPYMEHIKGLVGCVKILCTLCRVGKQLEHTGDSKGLLSFPWKSNPDLISWMLSARSRRPDGGERVEAEGAGALPLSPNGFQSDMLTLMISSMLFREQVPEKWSICIRGTNPYTSEQSMMGYFRQERSL